MKRKRRSPKPAWSAEASAPGVGRADPGAGSDGAGSRLRAVLLVGLVLTLVVLLLHAWSYAFLTDDAFISFRYARNLAHGHGLVFNPGGERVEGYSNLLWVLLLALLDRVGIPPERAAIPLSLLLTACLWAVVAAFAWRQRPGRGAWLVLVPTLLLAATRSVAVWSTGGLETRLFELLIVAGVIRQVVEIEAMLAGRGRRFAAAPWLFALASLTRPDGILISVSVFATALALTWRRAPGRWPGLVKGWVPFGVLVAAHFAFRLWYYHAWLPNTYYAKVGGHLWLGPGLRYVAAFVLEYAAFLWVPLLVMAVVHHRREHSAIVPVLFAAAILPHVLYVVAIGGDHFEYRPLDLYFPLLFLLLLSGAREWMRRWGRASVSVYLATVLAGLLVIPWESHRQFPDWYMSGFPGLATNRESVAADYLDPDRSAILRLPGLRQLAALHRRLLMDLTTDFVCIRQEEHRMFLQTTLDEGRRVRGLIERGMLPRDVRIALDCVGAVPYVSDAWTLDRLGLTDAHIARSASVRRLMAHSKSATLDYARERSVDLWPIDMAHCLVPYSSVRLIAAVMGARDGAARGGVDTTWAPDRIYAADAGRGYLLVCALPMGIESARLRMPELQLRPLEDPVFFRSFVARSLQACRDSLQADPDNAGMRYRVNFLEREAAAIASSPAMPSTR